MMGNFDMNLPVQLAVFSAGSHLTILKIDFALKTGA
jgi:hypothetical protein